jgi:excisionase family DNA binding protein
MELYQSRRTGKEAGGMEENSQTMALSIKGAAELVGISPRHLRRLITNQEGPPLVRLGIRTVIRRQALADWLKSREEASAA